MRDMNFNGLLRAIAAFTVAMLSVALFLGSLMVVVMTLANTQRHPLVTIGGLLGMFIGSLSLWLANYRIAREN